MAKKKITPMMQQYFDVKRNLPSNTLLLFRLGDFYEMFHEDAEIGAQLLGITLTKRSDYKMAGIPFHAAEQYIGKALQAGKKVAICDQVETPKPGKLVKRSLTRILTPGTAIEDNQLESNRNHYLAAIEFEAKEAELAWLDLSTGEFQIASGKSIDDLMPVLTSIDPAEVLIIEGEENRWRAMAHDGSSHDELIPVSYTHLTLPTNREV